MYILPTYKYVAINNENEKYFYLNERDLDQCTNFKEIFICEVQPLFKISSNSPCEIRMIKHEKTNLNKNCNIRVKSLDQSIFQKMSTQNLWLFSMVNKTSLDIICKEDNFVEEIRESGMIRLDSHCIAKSNEIQLRPTKTVAYSQTYKISEPYLNLTNVLENNMNFEIKNFSNIFPEGNNFDVLDNNLEKSDSLQNIVQKIQTIRKNKLLEEKIEKSQNLYYIYFMVIFVSSAILCITYVTFKCLKIRSSVMKTPLTQTILPSAASNKTHEKPAAVKITQTLPEICYSNNSYETISISPDCPDIEITRKAKTKSNKRKKRLTENIVHEDIQFYHDRIV